MEGWLIIVPGRISVKFASFICLEYQNRDDQYGALLVWNESDICVVNCHLTIKEADIVEHQLNIFKMRAL